VSRKVFRTALIVPMVLLMALLGPGPAFASPLRTTNARAFGASIDLLGAGLIAPTPLATAGPGPGDDSGNLLAVPLGTLVSDGTVSARAQTARESVLTAGIPATNLRVFSPNGSPRPANFNARAYGRVDGLVILADDTVGLPPAVEPVFDLGDVLSADVVHAEALVSCVDGVTTIVGGSQLAGVSLLGTDLTQLVDGTLNQVVSVGNTLLSLLGGSVIANEVVASGPDSLSLNALHVRIPNLLDVTLAHAEVTGATCEPVRRPFQCEDGIDNDGDGKIDFPADPGCFSRQDDDERDLARTGGMGPGIGFAVLGGAGLLMLAAYRLRRWKVQDNM
jgi:hypothetical protein